MKTIYGVRMIDTDDIINCSTVGRPSEICEYLKNQMINNVDVTEIYNDCKFILDTSLQGNMPVLNIIKPIKLIFIPVDYVEEKIINEGIINYLRHIEDKMISLRRSRDIDEIIAKCEEACYSVEEKYKKPTDILDATCFMFLYENDSFVDVYTTIPAQIIKNVLINKQAYECCLCGKNIEINNSDIITNSFPIVDMHYQVVDNKILYYCNECIKVHNITNLKHVGD